MEHIKAKTAFLTIDAGSSSMRVGVLSETAEILYMYQKPYLEIEHSDGNVDMNPNVFTELLAESISAACRFAADNALSVAAVGVTALRSAVVPVDSNGSPLYWLIMWHDKRSVPICDEVNNNYNIFPICGMRATHVYSAPKIAWLYRNERSIYEKTYKFMGVQDLLIHTMTGEFVTDTSFASRTALLDIRKLVWSEELLGLFNVDPEKLCRLIDAGSCAGRITAEFSRRTGLAQGTPVFSAGGDQQCAVLGLNIVRQGQAMVNTGTGAYVVCITDRPVIDKDCNVLCNVSAIKGKYILEASSMSSGTVFNWFNESFFSSGENVKHRYKQIEKAICESEPGAKGVLMLPCILGKGTPYWDPYIRGMFCNITLRAGRNDFARAMIEGLAAELADCVRLFEALIGRIDEIVSCGGLSNFVEYNKILADTLGANIRVSSVPETTTTGVWISLAKSTGLYADYESAFKASGITYTNSVVWDAANNSIYEKCNEARRRLLASVDFEHIYKLLQTGGATIRPEC